MVVTVFKIVAPTLCVGGVGSIPTLSAICTHSARLSRTPATAGWILCCRRASAARSISFTSSFQVTSKSCFVALYTSAAVAVR